MLCRNYFLQNVKNFLSKIVYFFKSESVTIFITQQKVNKNAEAELCHAQVNLG